MTLYRSSLTCKTKVYDTIISQRRSRVYSPRSKVSGNELNRLWGRWPGPGPTRNAASLSAEPVPVAHPHFAISAHECTYRHRHGTALNQLGTCAEDSTGTRRRCGLTSAPSQACLIASPLRRGISRRWCGASKATSPSQLMRRCLEPLDWAEITGPPGPNGSFRRPGQKVAMVRDGSLRPTGRRHTMP